MLHNIKLVPANVGGLADERNATNNNKLNSKGKPVFSWIRNSINNNNTEVTKPNKILSTDRINSNNTSNNNNKENSYQPELSGVQNLKHLWNSRINAIKDTRRSSKLSSAKSYGCLLQGKESSVPAVTRTLSLHNCAEINEFNPSLRSTKDNFYKYKTAATTEKNNTSPASTPTHTFSSRLSFNFPKIGATSNGEKIHWMRRDDLLVRKKNSAEQPPPLPSPETDTKMNLMTSPTEIKASPATPLVPPIESPHILIAGDNDNDNNSNDSSHPVSETRERDAISLHSLRSTESTAPRRKNANSNRKYSFKTQVKSYHSPRKMPYHTSNNASNKVAKLTQQFNEIIQKDKNILDEVKRNNGILISRGGHVYKVIENSEQPMTKVTPSATVLPVGKDTPWASKNISTVQRAIKTFESRTSEKPKVPLKSAQVLRKKNELVSKKEVACVLQPAVLEGIQEEAKVSPVEYSKLNTVGEIKNKPTLNIDCNRRVNEVVELIENFGNGPTNENHVNKSADEVGSAKREDCIENEIKSESPTKSRYTKIYEKFRFRGALRKLDQAESAQADLMKSRRTQMKLQLKVANMSDEATDIGQEVLSMPTSACPIDQSSEAKIQRLDVNSAEERVDPIATDCQLRKETHFEVPTDAENSLKDEFKGAMHQYVDEKEETAQHQLGEHKILDAIEKVNQKIESLAWRSDDQFGFICAPNDSFLYQVNSKVNDKESSLLVEAVNTSLVNFAGSQKTDCGDTDLPDIKANIEAKSIEPANTAPVESIYEFIAVDPQLGVESTVQPQKSFLFCKSSRKEGSHETLKDSQQKPLDSCESSSNYESINGSCEAKPTVDYGYEICENSEPAPPPPRPQKEPTELQRNTTDKLPELPKPKRIIPKKIFSTVVNSDISSLVSETGSINDEENIYDTIKGGNQHCYELLESSKEKKGADTISLTSNGYESINNYRRLPPLCKAESSSTISSDHKTNSLYEVSMVNGMLAGCHNYSHSYIASSENSDDWVDMSDSEVNNYDQIEKQQFIVVRERTKCHRSPDWSKRVRDKRLLQNINDDDDVDHYYEPLFPVGNKRVASTPEPPRGTHYGSNNTYLPEDYDSFDTDDDVYEDEESMKKNDSGVDISHVKLPNPPPSRNQVYAFVKKVKNFISSKKSPSDPNKNLADSVQAKMYENTQFHVEGNDYQSTLKPTRRAPDKPKTPKIKVKKVIDRPINTANDRDENIYENTDFHTAKLNTTSHLNSDSAVKLSTSEKNLIAANDLTIRSKSKTGKSFKSRLKSLGATSFDSKQMSTLAGARSTFYVSETAEQDSGIFEKTSSGDLMTSKPEAEPAEIKPIAAVRKNKKELNTSSSYRRRTTIGIRPNDPPPPPPTLLEDSKKPKQRTSTTSWYAECGVFKTDSNMTIDDANSERLNSNLNKSTSSTSWYAEAGLYQTSGVSVASSSGSSGVSTGNEGTNSDEIGHHMFLNEPLYQIYSAEKLESISRDLEDHESIDGYEEIGINGHTSENDRIKRTRPTALQLVGPKSGPSRTLWSEIQEVITSEILQTLTPRERSLQEAKFEIITSEASYLKSLNLLRSHFMNHHTFHDSAILSSRDRRTLFSYIAPVHECSEKLLSELENCWQDNIMLLGLSKSIYTCAEKHFQVYVSYCEHQGKMDRALRRLKEAKGVFSQKLDLLESDPICCGLTLYSFLMLPMQRITRLPLLIDAVFSKVHPNDDEYENWKLTLAILNKIVAQCNEAANRCEQAHEIERISRQLEFPSHIRALAIAPVGVAATGAKPRFLVKKGELFHLIWRGDDAKLTFGKKFTKSNIYAFLFSDLMVLTKRKSDEQFVVFDYCPRNMLTISSGDAIPQLPTKDANQTGKNLILMTLLENYERKTVELVLSCPSVSEMERWLQATRPPEAETPGEKLYEQWDCPQVIAKHEYVANEPDLLSLEVGDVVNVLRKLPDGWFNGERIRDGAVGWFHESYTEEVNSAHVRARNLKQRYRLLTFTATYLEMQKRK